MKKALSIIAFCLVAILALVYLYKLDLGNIIGNISISEPCDKPIEYSLGTFDTQFGISKSEFLADIAKAAKIWDDASGKTLFTSTQNGSLKINLIYDYRQEATAKLKSIGLVIKDDKATFDSLQAKYIAETSSYTAGKAVLETEVAKVNSDKAAYESEVAYWNTQGGAPQSEYDKLKLEQNSLNNEIDDANQKQTKLNDEADTIDSLATVINQLISDLNLSVTKYNSTSSSTGEEFDEGEYVEDTSGHYINIYQFEDADKLLRVLTHELGHSLGMQHVLDPKAIMYKLNQSSNEVPTAADIAELDRVCKISK